MKFWCGSSKQRKSFAKKTIKSNDSFSSSISYETISSIPKSDSGYSEINSNIKTYSYLEQILLTEKIYHNNLKNFIMKYSRPLRRYLHPEEIVELFQNIEKIYAISESIIRQCENLLDEDNTTDAPISSIYQSWFNIMIDSYKTYISQNFKAQTILKQCENKISYFLQISIECLRRELTEFLLLPIRHICLLNDLFQSFMMEYTDLLNHMDLKIIQNIGLLSKQVNDIIQPSFDNLDSSQDITLESEISPILVFQRTDKDPWESKQLELSDSKLIFTQLNRISSIYLSNVLHIEENYTNMELHLIIASSTISKYSRYSSIKMKNVYIRFEEKNDYIIWLEYLTYAIQKAKDQSWSKTNELVI